jgi:hypothetical protein
MKIMLTFLGLLLLMVTFGAARQQQHGVESCGFALQGEPTHPTVTGPNDILPLIYVVEQPDSPIEVVSVDLTGMWLSVANEQHTERYCATYEVRNRSDRPVQAFDVELSVSTLDGAGGFGAHPSSSLAPGQLVEIKSCGGGGRGGAPGNHVRLLVTVQSVDFGDCFYRPSVRIPRNLGVQHPV